MSPERTTDHVEQGLGLLLDQYKGKPLMEGWVGSYLKQIQELENVGYDVLISRWVDNAIGPRLDTIGRLVGELRHDRDDDLYRVFLRARIRINRSKGNPKDFLEVLAIIGAPALIFAEYPPASLQIELLTAPDMDPVLLFGMLFDTKAAGVKVGLISPTADPGTRFLCKDVAAADVPANGCGDASNPGNFGLLSDAVTNR